MSIRCKGLQKCKGLHRTLREETITIQNVAELAGVSVATVSRVINGIQNVRNDTKEKVLAAMEELNYSPNASARNLSGIYIRPPIPSYCLTKAVVSIGVTTV